MVKGSSGFETLHHAPHVCSWNITIFLWALYSQSLLIATFSWFAIFSSNNNFSLDERVPASSFAVEYAPSSQYGVKSPLSTGILLPYNFSNLSNISETFASTSLGETYFSFHFLTKSEMVLSVGPLSETILYLH